MKTTEPSGAALWKIAHDLKNADCAKSEQTAKQPKKTDAIKALLAEYTNLQKSIDRKEKRLECLLLTMGAPSTPNYSGMPGGSRDNSSKVERAFIKTEELREKLADMYAEENQRREELEAMIELMEKPDEQTVIEMHYLDGAKWWPICEALYEDEPDYEENEQRYLKRTFKVHGSALQTLAKIYRENRNQ